MEWIADTHTFVEECRYYYQMVDDTVVMISKERCLATLVCNTLPKR